MKRAHVTAAMLLAAAATTAGAGSESRGFITENEPLPFYARVLTHIFEGNQGALWAGVIFVRPPSCVPEDFNLLDFFAVPDAFACVPMTVASFTLRKEAPPSPPLQFVSHGLGAVPLWLVDAADMEAAVSDGVLTIGEVEALPSLVSGTATTYVEMGQPSPRDPRQLTITGSGTLEDGRAFQINGGGKHLIIDVR